MNWLRVPQWDPTQPTITTCPTCGAQVASDNQTLHNNWHQQTKAEAQAIQRVLDFDQRMQP